jgi:RHS repeat-associated protein
LGSTTNLTDANGILKASYSYDPWGKLLNPIDPLGTKNKYKFTEESLDPGSGLYYFRSRFFDVTSGRFLTRDPLRTFLTGPDSLNKYRYAQDNPIRFTDPSGLTAIDAETSGNTQSTPLLGTSSSWSCPVGCVLSIVDNIGNVLSVARPLSSVATKVGDFYPLYAVPFELGRELANGESRGSALLNVGAKQLLDTGVPLAALRLFGGEADVFASVFLYAFNYGLPTAR